jgi:hypothetical protein
VFAGERRAGAAEAGLDLVGDEQRAVSGAQLAYAGQPPWIGSASTATTLSSIASASACRSPYGTIRKPGVYGPNPSRASGSVEKLTIVVVRPWKLPSNTTMTASPSGTPLTS